MIQVALDGPAGAGKSTIAKKVAKKMGYLYVDTGAMYRGIALYYLQNKIDFSKEDLVESHLKNISLEMKYINQEQRVFLNGQDISDAIRDNDISMISSKVSAYPCVRQFLLQQQRDLANANSVIMDGRDIGTVVLPDAKVKIFLTASPRKRAMRRHWQLKSKGIYKNVKELMKEIKQRDHEDRNRKIAPLKQAEDAILLDNSNLNLSQSVREIVRIIQEKIE